VLHFVVVVVEVTASVRIGCHHGVEGGLLLFLLLVLILLLFSTSGTAGQPGGITVALVTVHTVICVAFAFRCVAVLHFVVVVVEVSASVRIGFHHGVEGSLLFLLLLVIIVLLFDTDDTTVVATRLLIFFRPSFWSA